MYMLVFVTLIVALIGLYTQVFNVQMAHIYAQQSGIAKAMLDWHATAVGLAENTVSASYVAGVGGTCSLTQYFMTPLYCDYNNSAGANPNTGPVYLSTSTVTGVSVPVGIPACGAAPSPCYVSLPQGYTKGNNPFAFNSIVYQGASQSYVLTFVPPPPKQGNGAPGFVCLPGLIPAANCAGVAGQQQIDIVLNDLLIQLQRRGVSAYSYGTVNGTNQLVTPSVPSSNNNVLATLSYTLPAIVPPGAVGVISQVNICSNC